MDKKAHSNIRHALEWKNLSVRSPKGDRNLLHPQSGSIRSGQLLAVMGPSGAGKSTFLDVISKRVPTATGNAEISFDGSTHFDMRQVGSYVEQDDALLGVLTVEETVDYAARLSFPHGTSNDVIKTLVSSTLSSLGLSDVAKNRIGTPIQRGISGGQKRRVTIACSVVSRPHILLCDEPTSGLDSMTSYQVISSIKELARDTNTIVIATIHQPNWETFHLFDRVLFLSGGQCMYQGSVEQVVPYFTQLGHPCPPHTNPADHVMGIINTDFSSSTHSAGPESTLEEGHYRLDSFAEKWRSQSPEDLLAADQYDSQPEQEIAITSLPHDEGKVNENNPPSLLYKSEVGVRANGHEALDDLNRTWILIKRMTLNYRRNLLAYGVRLAMYAGMGFLLATIWIRLDKIDSKINDRLSVHFFSVAFLGFMSVAGIPSFLEERATFVRERGNGLYGPGAYVIANSLVTIPFLFICATLFSVICYWAIGLHPGGTAFFRFLSFLFLAIYIAEAQSVVVAAIIPIFVAALAIASFLNGFWMCVQGYFIRAVNLPRFWYYWAHWIDYQTFAFNLLVRNDFEGLRFQCNTLIDGTCHCSIPSSLIASGQCAIAGQDVLKDLDINGFSVGLYASILVIIAIFYRVLFYVVLVFRK